MFFFRCELFKVETVRSCGKLEPCAISLLCNFLDLYLQRERQIVIQRNEGKRCRVTANLLRELRRLRMERCIVAVGGAMVNCRCKAWASRRFFNPAALSRFEWAG